jgi:predicted nucleotidyltransferase
MTKESFPAIAEARQYSDETLTAVRKLLAAKSLGSNVCVVATGSFGRREASGESDVDFFVLHDDSVTSAAAEALVADLATAIQSVVPKPPSEDGAFSAAEPIDVMLNNIGGEKDANRKMTRRVLLLLEGTHLYHPELFEAFQRRTLERYVRPVISPAALARFLLNDIIRYYRTMCVDFEYKTTEVGKSWGVRNLKLMYSRKMLYFGGVVAIAESAHRTCDQKLEVLSTLFRLTPIERIQTLFGDQARECLRMYDAFLAALGDEAFRREVETVTANRNTHTDNFKRVKADATQFSLALHRLLASRYPISHPIHDALVF